MYGAYGSFLLCKRHCLLCSLLNTGSLQCGNFHHLAAELFAELIYMNLISCFFKDIHHVDCHNYRNAKLHDLRGKIQVSLYIGSIYYIDNGIRSLTDQVISGNHFLKRVGR